MSVGILVGKQNHDGGWPYVRGGSWTEPTVYAVLALLSAGETEPAGRGLKWLVRAQRRDGGWPPRYGVDQSTWVTGLVALLSPEQLGVEAHGHALAWLLRAVGRESTVLYRLREWLLGVSRPPEQEHPGWPWIPGTSGWVGPTAIAMLALEQAYRRRRAEPVQRRLDSGRQFLLTRICKEGGWNYGSARPLGYDSNPYPETTGMALAALRGVRTPAVEQAMGTALRFLGECRSADGLNWLEIGLAAQGRLPDGYQRPAGVEPRTLPETAMAMIASAPGHGRGLLWGSRNAT